MKLEGANLGPCIVGFCGNSHAVNGTEHYWVPRASPQGRLGGLDLTTGIGHGTVGRDVPAPWQTVLIISHPADALQGIAPVGWRWLHKLPRSSAIIW